MKLIIDIHEKDYQSIKNGHIPFNVLDAIKNGTPLPEHHGRLIDSEVLGDYFWDNRSKLFEHKDLQIAIDNVPTIIEAEEE